MTVDSATPVRSEEQHMPILPLLSDAELARLFFRDPPGLRRYQVVHDVLVQQLSQQQAADKYGVCVRSVRLALTRFRKGGFDALHSTRNETRWHPATHRARQLLMQFSARTRMPLSERIAPELTTYWLPRGFRSADERCTAYEEKFLVADVGTRMGFVGSCAPRSVSSSRILRSSSVAAY
jgi:Trp operon repressor